MRLKKNILLFVTLFLLIIPMKATHNRAGEITFKQVSGLTYRITIKTFTYTLSLADRPELEVDWGDNTISQVRRTPYFRNETVKLPGFYQLNVYDTIHTFPGPGIYEVVVQDPNRNFGVINIPNSVNVVFSISTTIMISPELEKNNTPVLLSLPIDKAARGHVFVHNPVAYDSDGDSLSYRLSICRGENGVPLSRYTFPEASNRPLYIDPVYGNLIWDTPVDTGIYNSAIDIEEWRNGIKIGNILRDMQVEVYETTNNPPVNEAIPEFCVIAGDSVYFDVYTTDVDQDRVQHEFIGGPFEISYKPQITSLIDTFGIKGSHFNWLTHCDHVRKLPYNIVLKSTDLNSDISLVDIDNFLIRVIGPPPQNLEAEPTSSEIELTWEAQNCQKIVGYHVFRRVGSGISVPDSCYTGISPESGFVFIGKTERASISTYIDNDNGRGLAQGIEYCYVVAAEYEDGALSVVSNEACAVLLPGVPPILNVSVTNIDEVNGEIFLSWIKPRQLDTIPATGPFEVIISRSDNLGGENLTGIYSFTADSLNDTTYTDSNINTVEFPYSYEVAIYNNEVGNRFLIGNPETASSLYPEIIGMDNALYLDFVKDVPWLNTSYTVYSYDTENDTYDSVGFTNEPFYIVDGLNNGKEYCYKVKSKGWRMIDSAIFVNENWSHYNCGVPIDTFPPCPPDLMVKTICDSLTNHLQWNDLNNFCADDVVQYRIFYASTLEGELEEVAVVSNPLDTFFYHFPESGPAGCYAVSAVDSFNNESDLSAKVCVDECSGYELPNIFTPNNDGYNDVYTSINPNGYVKNVNMQIFNRWGMLVYETNDPDINWDGRYYKNNNIVSSGVYYYTCEVFENRLIGTVTRNLVGFIHVYNGESNITVPVD